MAPRNSAGDLRSSVLFLLLLHCFSTGHLLVPETDRVLIGNVAKKTRVSWAPWKTSTSYAITEEMQLPKLMQDAEDIQTQAQQGRNICILYTVLNRVDNASIKNITGTWSSIHTSRNPAWTTHE